MIELTWPLEQILELDVFWLRDLHEAWADCPPVRRMLAAFFGIKPKDRREGDLAELLAMFPNGQMVAGGKP